MSRPEIGIPTLLVYRECKCGWWCATGEGACAPICPECGGKAVPGGGGTHEALYGASADDSRTRRGLGFVGFLTNEIAGAGLVARVQNILGISQARMAHDHSPPAPYFTGHEIDHYFGDERAA